MFYVTMLIYINVNNMVWYEYHTFNFIMYFLTEVLHIMLFLLVKLQILFPVVIFYNNCFTIHILDTNYI
jgi:hypothetical protein